MGKEIERIMDYGFVPGAESKIMYFLKKLHKISLDNSTLWEKEIFNFFSENLLVPYIVCTSTDDSNDAEFFEEIKNHIAGKLLYGGAIIWDSNDCYRDLNKIYESVLSGKKLVEYLPYFFTNNYLIRQMLIKRVDNEDLRYKNFGFSIKPVCCELKNKDGIVGFENVYFFLPDKEIDYPIEEWHKKISSEWRVKLNKKFHPTKKKTKKRNPLDSRLRHECFKRDHYKCKECGATKKEKILHCDHILPVAQGGSDELDNLQTLCDDCNLAKSNKKWVAGDGEREN